MLALNVAKFKIEFLLIAYECVIKTNIINIDKVSFSDFFIFEIQSLFVVCCCIVSQCRNLITMERDELFNKAGQLWSEVRTEIKDGIQQMKLTYLQFQQICCIRTCKSKCFRTNRLRRT